MNKIRGFEEVDFSMKKNNVPAIMPKRGTKTSAGYDFATPEEIWIPAHSTAFFWTDVKAYMLVGEVLLLNIRSSIGVKKGLRLSNTIGVIDQDYYSNPGNDGNIGISLDNPTNKAVVLEVGERIAQGIFASFLEADNGNTEDKRVDGFGSTGIK